MDLLSSFQPRAEVAAKRVILGLTTVGCGTTVLFTVLFPTVQTSTDATVTVAGCVVLMALATAVGIRRTCALWMWVAYPIAGVVMIAVLDVCSHDATLTAQIFFVFPVLYAGAQLRRPAAIALCAAAIAADLVVTLDQLAWSTALVDVSFLAAVLIAASALLVVAGERNDVLIAELEHQAAVDPLTGLVTRRVLDRVAAAALMGSATGVGTAMLLVDLDRFKHVNDVHGHPAGDAVLQQLAAVLLSANRRTDVISRMGGDEIAVFMPSCALSFAVARAEQILLEVRAFTFDISACTTAAAADRRPGLNLSVSIGVAHLPTHGTDLRELYAAADMSLYAAKATGRDQVGPAPNVGMESVLAVSPYGTAAAAGGSTAVAMGDEPLPAATLVGSSSAEPTTGHARISHYAAVAGPVPAVAEPPASRPPMARAIVAGARRRVLRESPPRRLGRLADRLHRRRS